MTGPFRRALSSSLRGVALPYGYTLTVWGSGQVMIELHGAPSIGQVFLFLAGAGVGYGALKWIAGERPSEVEPTIGSPHLLRAGALHVLAIGCAVGSAALVGNLASGAAWPLAAFLASVLYILITTVELSMLEAKQESG